MQQKLRCFKYSLRLCVRTKLQTNVISRSRWLHQTKQAPAGHSFCQLNLPKPEKTLPKTDDMLLRKVEELTLYIIEQQKQIDELKT